MISVLIVSHNTKAQLQSTLRTLDDLSSEWHEIIVVDNASKDGSAEMVRSVFPQHKLLALSKNEGFGRANNLAASLAKGEFLLLLNSDAWPLPGTLSSLRAKLTTKPGCGLAAPRLKYENGTSQFSWAPFTQPPRRSDSEAPLPMGGPCLDSSPPALLVATTREPRLVYGRLRPRSKFRLRIDRRVR